MGICLICSMGMALSCLSAPKLRVYYIRLTVDPSLKMIEDLTLTDVLTSQYGLSNCVFLHRRRAFAHALGNRVRIVDLDTQTSSTLGLELKHHITLIAVSADDQILIAVDREGRAIIYALGQQTLLSHFNFKKPVQHIVFAPQAPLFAAVLEHGFQAYFIPSLKRNFEPLYLVRKVSHLHSDRIKGCSISADGRFLLTWSKDLLVKFSSLFLIPQYVPFEFATHKEKVVIAFMRQNSIYTMDQAGVLFQWSWVQDYLTDEFVRLRNLQRHKVQSLSPAELDQALGQAATSLQRRINHGRFVMQKKHYFGVSGTRIKAVAVAWPYMFVAYKNGTLAVLHHPFQESNPLETVHFDFAIKSLSTSTDGKWISLSCESKLITYQWKSRAVIYTNKFYPKKAIGLAKQRVVAGGQGLCLYNSATGLNEHSFESDEITDVAVRGTLAAAITIFAEVLVIDLQKNLIFRRMKTGTPNRLISVAIDPTSQLIVSSGFDPYQIYVWNLRTGNLILNIADHQAPVTALSFVTLEHEQLLISGSWDKTARMHQMFSKTLSSQILQHNSQVVAIAAHPNGQEIATSTMNGQLCFWDIKSTNIKGLVPVAMDLQAGRSQAALASVKKDDSGKFLRCICFSPDGDYLVGAGKSKHLLIYSSKSHALIRRVSLTESLDLNNVRPKLNSKFIKEGINLAALSPESEASDYEDRKDNQLPGSLRRDVTRRSKKEPMECFDIAISDNGRQVFVATSAGLLVLGQSKERIFNPSNLTGCPQDIPRLLRQQKYADALLTTLSLGQPVRKLLKYIPVSLCAWVTTNLSDTNLARFLDVLVAEPINTEVQLVWLKAVLDRGLMTSGACLQKFVVAKEWMGSLQGRMDALSLIGSLKEDQDTQ